MQNSITLPERSREGTVRAEQKQPRTLGARLSAWLSGFHIIALVLLPIFVLVFAAGVVLYWAGEAARYALIPWVPLYYDTFPQFLRDGLLGPGLFAIGTLLPAFMYWFFLETRVPTIREEFDANLVRIGLNPGRLQYKNKFEAVYGATGDLKQVVQSPITIFTLILILGWIIVFHPPGEASESAADLFLVPRPDPMGYGFLGAYLFSLQLLFRRYVRSDLKHSVFVSISTRIITVVILVWAFSLLKDGGAAETGAELSGQLDGYRLSLLSFFIGMFPQTGIIFFEQLGNRLLHLGQPSRVQEEYPLGEIEGITVWDENRLVDEGIETKQHLATADIVDLLLNTPFPAERLVDWIDQAMLHLHVRDKIEEYRSRGIRTATDILDLYQADRSRLRAVAEEIHGNREYANTLVGSLKADPNIRPIKYWRDYKSPHRAQTFVEWGKSELEEEKWERAIEAFNYVLEPYDTELAELPDAAVGRARAFYKQSEPELGPAIRDLELARQLDPDAVDDQELASLYLSCAKEIGDDRDYLGAAEQLEKAYALDADIPSEPWLARVQYEYGKSLIDTDPSAAIHAFEKLERRVSAEMRADAAVSRAPFAEAYFSRGRQAENEGNHEHAGQDYHRATELDGDLAEAWNRHAWVQIEYLCAKLADDEARGRCMENATDSAQRAVDLAAESGDDQLRAAALDTLGWGYFKRGMLDQAEKFLTQCLTLAPTADIARDHLRLVQAQRQIES